MAEATDFKYDMQLVFAKLHITPKEKSGHGLGLTKIWGSPLLFPQWLKLSTSNLVCRLGLPWPIIEIHPKEKWAWPWVRESQIFGVPLYYFCNG